MRRGRRVGYQPQVRELERRELLTAAAVHWGMATYVLGAGPDSIKATPGMSIGVEITLPNDFQDNYTGVDFYTLTFSTALDPEDTSYQNPNPSLRPQIDTWGKYREGTVTRTGHPGVDNNGFNVYTADSVMDGVYAPKEPGTYSVTASVTYWCYDQDTMLHYNKTLSTTLSYQVVVPYTAWFKVASDNNTDQTNPYPGMAPPLSFCYFDPITYTVTSDPSASWVGFSFLQPDGSGQMNVGYWGYVRNDTPYNLDYNVIQIVKQSYLRKEWADGTSVETTFDKALDVLSLSTSFYLNSPSIT